MLQFTPPFKKANNFSKKSNLDIKKQKNRKTQFKNQAQQSQQDKSKPLLRRSILRQAHKTRAPCKAGKHPGSD